MSRKGLRRRVARGEDWTKEEAVRNIVELLDPANGMAAEVNPRGVRYFDERDIAACLSALDCTP